MGVCNITKHKNRQSELKCDYNAEFVEKLKKLIPHIARSYDPATKIWTFEGNFTDAVSALAQKYFKKVSLIKHANGKKITKRLHSGIVETQNSLFGGE